MENDTGTCKTCGVTKSLETGFYRNKNCSIGFSLAVCRECRHIANRTPEAMEYARHQAKQYRVRNPEKVRAAKRRQALQTLYGITVEEFDEMLSLQGGKCALCESSDPGGRWTTFHTDHNHLTGRVRGVLCYRCNQAMAWVDKIGATKIYDYAKE